MHRDAQRTGGGPALNSTLSLLEERVVGIMGTQAATGFINIPEVGLQDEIPESQPDTDSQSLIFELHQRASSAVEDWNRPGTSAQPAQPFIRPLDTAYSSERSGGAPEASSSSAPTGSNQYSQHALDSITPLPPTPRRQQRGRPLVSPIRRRTRTQTQSELARQAFARSDCEWRAFTQEVERERNRLRTEELRMQGRWQELFREFLTLGNKIANNLEKE